MILTFFLGKAAFCLRMVIRVDVRITAWRGMYTRLFHSRNLHLIWALSWCSYHGENISFAQKDEESSRGTERSIAKISTAETVLLPVTQLQGCIQKACVVERQPIHQPSRSCLQRLTSQEGASQHHLESKRLWLTDTDRWLTFFLCVQYLTSSSHFFTCLTGSNFLRL